MPAGDYTNCVPGQRTLQRCKWRGWLRESILCSLLLTADTVWPAASGACYLHLPPWWTELWNCVLKGALSPLRCGCQDYFNTTEKKPEVMYFLRLDRRSKFLSPVHLWMDVRLPGRKREWLLYNIGISYIATNTLYLKKWWRCVHGTQKLKAASSVQTMDTLSIK